MLLKGLHGFITGAGTGIGRGIALEMVCEGADLYITDLDVEAAQRTAEACEAEFARQSREGDQPRTDALIRKG
jgi:NAD(P)-dependent dehydrogenase (short-subunit alcohol dehydrogenase family)